MKELKLSKKATGAHAFAGCVSTTKTILSALITLLIISGTVSAVNTSGGITFGAMSVASAEIFSPADGARYGTASVFTNFTQAGNVTWELDGVPIAAPVNETLMTFADDGTDGGQTHVLTAIDGDTLVVLSSVTFRIDITAPAEATLLTSTGATADSITWQWTNSANTDFSNALIKVQKTSDLSVIVENVVVAGAPGSTGTYTATGLEASTSYTITVQTQDDAP